MAATPRRIGFLHTSPVHVPTFDALVAQVAGKGADGADGADAGATPGIEVRHSVSVALLDRARSEGRSAAVVTEVRERLRALVEAGCDVVVCTCSTIGDVAESVGDDLGDAGGRVRVLRVDRPMAEMAVRHGGRVGVVAALASTLEPTRRLLEEESDRAGSDVDIEEVLVEGAWAAFESGDLDGYHSGIASAARELAGRVDVVVLAQASMAPAVDLLGELATPVLSSPATAVQSLLTGADASRGRGSAQESAGP